MRTRGNFDGADAVMKLSLLTKTEIVGSQTSGRMRNPRNQGEGGVFSSSRRLWQCERCRANVSPLGKARWRATLTNVRVKRADFCEGDLNLRGWKQVAADVGKRPGVNALAE